MPRQPSPRPRRLRGALLDASGHGVVIRVPRFRCPAQPYEARPSRRSARFSLGNFVVCVRTRGGRFGVGVGPRARLWSVGIGHVRRLTATVGVGPLRIVHGESAYHFGLCSTP